MSSKTDKLTRTQAGGSTKKRIQVLVIFSSEEQKEEATFNAIEAGFRKKRNSGLSTFMRTLALGYKPMSIFDRRVISEMNTLSSNLGRVGNLLKGAIFKSSGIDDELLLSLIRELREWRIEHLETLELVNKEFRKLENGGRRKTSKTQKDDF